jgi:hypothetical protein
VLGHELAMGGRFDAETESMGPHQALSTVVKSSGGESASLGQRRGRGTG